MAVVTKSRRTCYPQQGVVQELLTLGKGSLDEHGCSAGSGTGGPFRGAFRWGRASFYKYFIEPFVTSRNPPWFDARGVAVGLAVGFGCPVGGQIITLVLLRMIFRFNSIIAFAFTWVSNPFTMIPQYYLYFSIGSFLLGKPLPLNHETFRQLMMPLLDGGYFWETFHSFLSLGWELVTRWFLTGSILASVAATLGYVIAYQVQKYRCRRKAEQIGVSYERLLEELEDSIRAGHDLDH
ncbi:MAG: DUF2062 domain-containing protein [Deltaproteobacteria bacterium]